MFSRSKARHVKHFLYEDSEEDSGLAPKYVCFLFHWCYLIIYWFHFIWILLFGLH